MSRESRSFALNWTDPEPISEEPIVPVGIAPAIGTKPIPGKPPPPLVTGRDGITVDSNGFQYTARLDLSDLPDAANEAGLWAPVWQIGDGRVSRFPLSDLRADVRAIETNFQGHVDVALAALNDDQNQFEAEQTARQGAFENDASARMASSETTIVGYMDATTARVASVETTVAGKLDDAPRDGNPYARKDGAWVVAAAGGASTWDAITGKPATFPPSPHTHPWTEVTGKPATFPPSAHRHPWSDLDSVPVSFPPSAHTHLWADITDKPATFAPSAHTHNASDINAGKLGFNRLPVAASGVSSTNEVVRADDSRLSNARPPTAHSHPTSEITGLDTALAGKVGTDDPRLSDARTPTAHTHDDRYLQLSGGTLTGKLNLPVTTPARASINIPLGDFADPTAPVDGDLWATWNTGPDFAPGLLFRMGGVNQLVSFFGHLHDDRYLVADTFWLLMPEKFDKSGGTISGETWIDAPLHVSGNLVWHAGNLDPATFAPATHTHAQSEITGLAPALAAKADSSWTQNGTGAIARTVHDKLKDIIYVEDFGAVGNGVADDRAAIQAAINAAATIGTGRGCKVHLRARAYKLSSGITLPSWVKLVGEGAGATRLVPSFTTGDVVSIGDGSATVAEHVTVEGLSIEPQSPMTGGALIALKNHFWAMVRGIRLPINANINIRIDNGPTSYLAWFDDVFTATGTHGMQIGTGAGLDCQGVFITNSEFANHTTAGLEILNCGGLMIDTSEFLTCQKALVTFPAAGRRIKGMMISQCWFDTSHATGVEIVTNGGEVTDNLFDACWFSSAGNVDGTSSNVRVSPGTGLISGLQFGDCRSLGAKGHGYLVEGGVDLTWSNCQTFANSMAGSALYDGIVIGAGVSQWQIHGGQSGKGGTFWGLNQQRYGVNVLAGASDNYTIVNHDVRENVTGGIADGGTGTNKHIACCLGARTTNQGAGSIASGSQTAVISHGLSFTPATTDIIVVPVTQLSVSGLTQIWVSAASSTTFTVTANTPATATSFFSWSARVKGA